MMNDKINTFAQVDADIGTRIELASRLGLSVFTLNIIVNIDNMIVNNREEIEVVSSVDLSLSSGNHLNIRRWRS